jgi:hypothetical protein
MPNHGGTTVDATLFKSVGGLLHIQPVLGYYNDESLIKTTIQYKTVADRTFNTTKIDV